MFRFLTRISPRFTLAGLLAMTMATSAAEGQPVPPPTPLSVPPSDPEAIVNTRFHFTIDANTATKDLLPIPPKMVGERVRIVNDLAQVPEIFFQDPLSLGEAGAPAGGFGATGSPFKLEPVTPADILKARKLLAGKNVSDAELRDTAQLLANDRGLAKQRIAHQIAKIHVLNKKKTDGFMEAMIQNRPDLAGLPFMMNAACRLKEEDKLGFSLGVTMVNNALPNKNPTEFWKSYNAGRGPVVGGLPNREIPNREKMQLAALMQIMPRETPELRKSLVHQLTSFNKTAADKIEATKALAKLSVFSPDDDVRRTAGDILLKRPTGPATDVLKQGLRYPWPAVAQNAADAVVRQQRDDLIPELISMLETPDPRTPIVKEQDGKKSLMVREVVRINHLRNCLLCHAPGNIANSTHQISMQGKLSSTFSVSKVVVAAVPPPGHEMPSNPSGPPAYYSPQDEIVVRADVTYLRQDFSLMMKVDNAAPWPEMQRFDFLVRNKAVSTEEAVYVKAELARAGGNPYQQAALGALRRLTGRDAGTTAQEWRKALGL